MSTTREDHDHAGDDWPQLGWAPAFAWISGHAPFLKLLRYPASACEDGSTVTGCGDAQYANCGLGVSAESTPVVLSVGSRLTAFACVNGHGDVMGTCGRRRQHRFGVAALVHTLQETSWVKTTAHVLPESFSAMSPLDTLTRF